MSTPADRYSAYTDGELADLWNRGTFAMREQDALLDEIRRRGYRLTPEGDLRGLVIVPAEHRDRVPGAADARAIRRYTVTLEGDPDSDGDYRAIIRDRPDGRLVHSMYGPDREQLRIDVAAWADLHREPPLPDEVYEV